MKATRARIGGCAAYALLFIAAFACSNVETPGTGGTTTAAGGAGSGGTSSSTASSSTASSSAASSSMASGSTFSSSAGSGGGAAYPGVAVSSDCAGPGSVELRVASEPQTCTSGPAGCPAFKARVCVAAADLHPGVLQVVGGITVQSWTGSVCDFTSLSMDGTLEIVAIDAQWISTKWTDVNPGNFTVTAIDLFICP